jgi:hypothetical protein
MTRNLSNTVMNSNMYAALIRLLFAITAATLLLSACVNIRLTSEYDEVIDKGIIEFAVQLNTHIKNMAELGGKQEGTYEATFRTYNALESQIDVLIERASAASEGKACQLEAKLFQKISTALKTSVPTDLPQGVGESGASSACNARLLVLVKEQLANIREIHKIADKCNGLSCIRASTARSAMAIINQSLTAVSIVEAAKKSP